VALDLVAVFCRLVVGAGVKAVALDLGLVLLIHALLIRHLQFLLRISLRPFGAVNSQDVREQRNLPISLYKIQIHPIAAG